MTTYIVPADFSHEDYLDDELGAPNFTAVHPLYLSSTTRQLTVAAASASSAGVISSNAQVLPGAKTFMSAPSYNAAPTASEHLANKGYVDSLISHSISWQNEVFSFHPMSSTSPVLPQPVGRRYIATLTQDGFIANSIYEVRADGTSYDEIVPEEGYAVAVTDDASPLFPNQTCLFNGTAWVNLGASISHGALIGLTGDDHSQYVKVSGRAGDTIIIPNTTDSTDRNLGSVRLSGGLGAMKQISAGCIAAYPTFGNVVPETHDCAYFGAAPADRCVISYYQDPSSAARSLNFSVDGNTIYMSQDRLHVASTLDSTYPFGDAAITTLGGISCAKAIVAGSTIRAAGTMTSRGCVIRSPDDGAALTLATANTTGHATFTPSVAGSTYTFARLTSGGDVIIQSATASSSTATGSLRTAGGLGVAGAAYIGGGLRSTQTTDSTSVTTGSFVCSGGLAVATGKACYLGGLIRSTDSTASTSATTGAATFAGGVGISGTLNVAGALSFAGILNVTNATASTSSSTGALVVTGGVGIGGQLSLGGPLVGGNTASEISGYYSTLSVITHTVYMQRLGKMVVLYWPNWSDATVTLAGAGGVGYFEFDTPLAASYRPAYDIGFPVTYALAGTYYSGTLNVFSATGIVRIYPQPGRTSWTAGSTFQLNAFSQCYVSS